MIFTYLKKWIGGTTRHPTPDKPEPIAMELNPRGWFPTHIHKKGGRYRVLMHAVLESDRSDVVVYDDFDGAVWVRSKSEFYDGRFAPVDQGERG